MSNDKHTSPKTDTNIEADNTLGDAEAPTWFSKTYGEEEGGNLAKRYRDVRANDPAFDTPGPDAYEAYRRRLEERFQSAKRIASGPVPAFSTFSSDRENPKAAVGDDGSQRFRDWQKKMNKRKVPHEAKAERTRPSAFRVASLFAVACTIGGLAGLGSANMDFVRASTTSMTNAASSGISAVTAYLPNWTDEAATGGSAGGNTVLNKKPIKMARVDVEDASGVLNHPIPLELTAIPADDDVPLALKITGLPDDAYLTQGTELVAGTWMLKPGEIEGVKLVVPQARSPQLDLAVAAVEEKTGTEAAPPREMTVELDLNSVSVLPASAPPEAQSNTTVALPLAIPLPQEAENSEARSLFTKGEALLKTGDIVSARQFFVKAHGLGLAEAAFGVGQCYDPAVYAAMNVYGLQPDADKALEWYQKAAATGHAGAIAAMSTLTAVAQP